MNINNKLLLTALCFQTLLNAQSPLDVGSEYKEERTLGLQKSQQSKIAEELAQQIIDPGHSKELTQEKDDPSKGLGMGKLFLRGCVKLFMKMLTVGRPVADSIMDSAYHFFRPTVTEAKLEFWNNIWSVDAVPTSVATDCSRYRAPTYMPLLSQASDNFVNQMFRLKNNPQKLHIPTDEQILLAMNYTTLAFYTKSQSYSKQEVEHGKSGTKRTLDMRIMNYQKIFPGYYHNIVEAEYDENTHEISFLSQHGRRYAPNPDGTESNLYKIAKFDFFCTAASFFSSLAHSWVHFHFPDVMSALANNYNNRADKNPTLARILEVHTRFTLAIDSDVLRVLRTPENNAQGWWGDHTYAVQPFPMLADDFLFGNSRRVEAFYNEDHGEFYCPPQLPDSPYVRTLMEYYKLTREFVGNIDKTDNAFLPALQGFLEEASEYMPQFENKEKFKPLDVLATFIWQVAILHPTDHYTSYKAYRNRPTDWGDTAIVGGVITPTVLRKDLAECNEDTNLYDIADQRYLTREEGLLDIYVRFNHDTEEATMDKIGTAYDFTRFLTDVSLANELNARALEFEKNLKALDSKLLDQPNELKGWKCFDTKKEIPGLRSRICPLNEMPQSITF